MKLNIFDGLNAEQMAAVKHTKGPSYINAGPGAGKTLVVVRKAAYAIMKGMKPEKMIIFTFTKKAANEIKERISDYIGEELANKMWIGTYHSICVRLLRTYSTYTGQNSKFGVLDSEDSKKIIAECCDAVHTQLNIDQAVSYISEQKRNLIGHQIAIQSASGIVEKYAMVYRNYQLRIESQNMMDFDDLICKTIYMIESYFKVKENIHNRFDFIICDESHDSSEADLKLIRLLTNSNENLTMILDTDQSIYAFRGSKSESVVAFRDSLKDVHTFNLTINYRSTSTIVEASARLISNNPILIPKSLKATEKNGEGDKIIFYEANDEKREYDKIIEFIELIHKEYHLPYKEIAILYRNRYTAKDLSKELSFYHIPHSIVGHIDFYGREEIKDLMSYLKTIYNPDDALSFFRSMGTPKRGIGKETGKKIYTYALEHEINLIQAAKECELSGRTRHAVNSYLEILQILRDEYWYNNPKEALTYILETTDYLKYLSVHHKDEADYDERYENILTLLDIAENYPNIEEMLEEISVSKDQAKKDDEGTVSLMTLHCSKGLEYDCVFICGCSETLIPSSKAVTPSQLEEERRLMYVGMTRARKFLFLTRSKVVKYLGTKKILTRSRYIKEIPPEYLYITY